MGAVGDLVWEGKKDRVAPPAAGLRSHFEDLAVALCAAVGDSINISGRVKGDLHRNEAVGSACELVDDRGVQGATGVCDFENCPASRGFAETIAPVECHAIEI